MSHKRLVVLASVVTGVIGLPMRSPAQTALHSSIRDEHLVVTYRPMRIDSSASLQKITGGGRVRVGLQIDSTGRAVPGSIRTDTLGDSSLERLAARIAEQMAWDSETARRVARQDVVVPFVFMFSVAGETPLLEEGTTGPGVVYLITRTDSTAPATAEAVVSLPQRVSGPQPWYPPQLQMAQIDGRVMVEALIDTLGHVERGSVRIVASSERGFEASARYVVEHSVFQVTRTPWRALRIRLHVPITYEIRH